jgi:hypothetical protein
MDEAIVEAVARALAGRRGEDYAATREWANMTDQQIDDRVRYGWACSIQTDMRGASRSRLAGWHDDARAALAVAVPMVEQRERAEYDELFDKAMGLSAALNLANDRAEKAEATLAAIRKGHDEGEGSEGTE